MNIFYLKYNISVLENCQTFWKWTISKNSEDLLWILSSPVQYNQKKRLPWIHHQFLHKNPRRKLSDSLSIHWSIKLTGQTAWRQGSRFPPHQVTLYWPMAQRLCCRHDHSGSPSKDRRDPYFPCPRSCPSSHMEALSQGESCMVENWWLFNHRSQNVILMSACLTL